MLADEFDFTYEERTKFIDDPDYFEKKVFKGIDFGYVPNSIKFIQTKRDKRKPNRRRHQMRTQKQGEQR